MDGSCHNLMIKDGSPMGIGVHITSAYGETLLSYGLAVGLGTNNIAEWEALERGLKECLQMVKSATGIKEIVIHSDSQIIVNQFAKAWAVKQVSFTPYLNRCHELRDKLKELGAHVTVKWVAREENMIADKLSKIGRDKEKLKH